MQIVLHVGPHKTGTTSIQRYLKRQLGSEIPSGANWYPMPSKRGPGHSALAFDVFDADGSELGRVIEQALSAGTPRVIISSEDFDLFYTRNMDRLQGILGAHAIHLMVTLNSPLARAASSWQESIKHGNQSTFDDWWPVLLNNPGYQPDFVRRFAEALGPEEVSVVFSDRDAPADRLLFNVLKALSLPINKADTMSRVNERLGYIECEVLRRLNDMLREYGNELSKAEKREIRAPLIKVMRSKEWTNLCPRVELKTPRPVLERLTEMAQQTLDDLRHLANEVPLSMYGEPEVLFKRDIAAPPVLSAGS